MAFTTPTNLSPAPAAYNANGGRGAGTFNTNADGSLSGGFNPANDESATTLAGAQKPNPNVDANGNFDAAKAYANRVNPAVLPPLTPTTTGSPQAQSNTVNPPVVANSNAAQTDLNNINSNANQIGGAVQQQQQVQLANTNAQTQANQQASQQAAQTQQEAPENQPITAGDLNQALQSVNQPGQVTTDANGIQSVAPTQDDGQNQLNQNINDIKDSYSPDINNLQNQENQGLAELAQVSDAQMQAASNVQSQINSVMNGTFPLSQGDQAQLTGLNAQYNQLISQAQSATQAYTAGVTAAGMASGRAMYTPELNLSLISQATQSGLQEVQTLTDEGAAAYAKLQSSLQQNDLNLIQSSYKATSDALTARSTAIQSTINNTKDAITQAYAQQHNDIQDAISSTQIGDSEKKNIFDEAMANAQFTNTQKQQIQDNYFKQQGLDLQAQQVAISQEDVSIKLQALQQTQLGNQLQELNALKTAASTNPDGSPKQYVDGTNLTADQQSQLLSQGVPVLSKDDAATMGSLQTGASALTSLAATLQSIGVMDAQGNLTSANVTTPSIGGDQEKDAIKQFNKSISDLAGTLQTAGVTGDIVSTLKDNSLATNGSGKDFSSSLSAIQSAISNAENTYLKAPAQVVTYQGQQYTVDANGNMTALGQ